MNNAIKVLSMFYIVAMTALVFDIIVERENLDCTAKVIGER